MQREKPYMSYFLGSSSTAADAAPAESGSLENQAGRGVFLSLSVT